jgi:hypothetical protein
LLLGHFKLHPAISHIHSHLSSPLIIATFCIGVIYNNKLRYVSCQEVFVTLCIKHFLLIQPADITLIKEQVELNKKELAVLNNQLTRAAEAYERGVYDLNWYITRKRNIEAEISDIMKEIASLGKRAKGYLPQKEIAKRIRDKKKIAKEALEESDAIKVKARLQEVIDRIEIKSENEINVFIRV